MKTTPSLSFTDLGKKVIEEEIEAIKKLLERVNESFDKACHILLNTSGRVVITGMGKSGHIGKKIAATMASTGTPAFFIHPGEANHGDLGMITRKDTLIAISNSGETAEVLNILPLLTRLAVPIISLTGNPHSSLAKYASANLDVSVDKEACPLGLAPTSSTTATLVMGDALAVALLKARGFSSDEFALFHPGGSLGRRLLLKTQELMHTGSAIPTVITQTTLREALYEMTQKRLGMTTVVDHQGALMGVFTDGDLRRCLDQNESLMDIQIDSVMTTHFVKIKSDTLAAHALKIMQDNKITCLLCVDKNNQLNGIIHLHDILQAGIA
jgi:arabinose-5-phosphate isomerase